MEWSGVEWSGEERSGEEWSGCAKTVATAYVVGSDAVGEKGVEDVTPLPTVHRKCQRTPSEAQTQNT